MNFTEKENTELDAKESIEIITDHLTKVHEDILKLRDEIEGSKSSNSLLSQVSSQMMSQMQKLEQENEELVKALNWAAKVT